MRRLLMLALAILLPLAASASTIHLPSDADSVRVQWTGWEFSNAVSTVHWQVTRDDTLMASGVAQDGPLPVQALTFAHMQYSPQLWAVTLLGIDEWGQEASCAARCTVLIDTILPPPPPLICMPGSVWVEVVTEPTERPLEGFGAHTPGGSYGETYTATTLAEFRAALGPNRTIEVEGDPTWELDGPINLDMSNLTWRGSVSIRPAPGYVGALVVVTGHDIILQDLDARNAVGAAGDNIRLTGIGCYNVVVDHCTCVGAEDGNLDIGQGAYDCTVQWSHIAYNAKGMLIAYGGATNVSVHHCWFDGCESRTPQINGGLIDVVNCVIEGWNGSGTRIDEGGQANIVNCVYQDCVPGREHRAVYVAEGELFFPVGSILPPECTVIGTTTHRFSAPMVTTMTAAECLVAVKAEAGAR